MEAYVEETESQQEPSELNEASLEFVDDLVKKLLLFIQSFCDIEYFPYQLPIAYSVVESVVIGAGDHKTLCCARQSGKSEVMASVIAGLMVILPRLSDVYPLWLGKFSKGFWCGVFAPTEEQADTIYGRVVGFLTSEHAVDILMDEEINDRATSGGTRGKGKVLTLKNCGSLCRMQTCNPKAKVEGRTYHMAFVDECFPAGTPVLTTEGWVPIDEIVTTAYNKDWIVATQGADNVVSWANVTRTYRTPRNQPLVRVDYEHGFVYTTANHPFMVGGSGVAAIDLREGTYLSVVQGAPQPFHSQAAEESIHADVLQSAQSRSVRQGRSDTWIEQSHEIRGTSREDEGHPEEYGAQTPHSGRKWSWSNHSPEGTVRCSDLTGSGLDSRVCNRYWGAHSEPSAVSLQGGHRTSVSEVGSGSGWVFTFQSGTSGAGSPEGSVFTESRVVSVTLLQQGCADLAQFSDGGDYVYTLGVASESHTYVAGGPLVGNCQGADESMILKSIVPMLSWYKGSLILAGTATREKCYFYKAIQINKRADANRRGHKRQLHHEYNWKQAAKYNENYAGSIEIAKVTMGEDSDEFRMSFKNEWLLEKGMFVTDERLDRMYEPSLQLVHEYWNSPVVVGIDVARSNDSTIVTIIFVDWDHPDGLGFYRHVVLDWLEINNVEWEDQYFQIVDFLRHYDVLRVGVDAQGVGGAVAERLALLLPRYFPSIEVISVSSDAKAQHERWVHLTQLIQRDLLTLPGHSKAKRTRRWVKFNQQMSDLERVQRGPYMLAAAPDERGAFDDYPDSLAIGCAMTIEDTASTVTVVDNMFYSRSR